MRVQRAPRAAQQPQQPPAGVDSTSRRNGSTHHPAAASADPAVVLGAPAVATMSWFSAAVDLDLIGPAKRLGPSRLMAEIVVLLVEACRTEGLIDDESPLRIARPSNDGILGYQFDPAVRQSAYAIDSAWDSLTARLPAPVAGALTVLDLGAVRAATAGDWGLGGVAVATFGPAVPTVVSRTQADGSGLSLAQRELTALGLVVPDGRTHAPGVLRVLASVTQSVRVLGR